MEINLQENSNVFPISLFDILCWLFLYKIYRASRILLELQVGCFISHTHDFYAATISNTVKVLCNIKQSTEYHGKS